MITWNKFFSLQGRQVFYVSFCTTFFFNFYFTGMNKDSHFPLLVSIFNECTYSRVLSDLSYKRKYCATVIWK